MKKSAQESIKPVRMVDKLAGLFTDKPEVKKTKGSGRKPPKIQEKHVVLKGTKDGKNVTIRNYKAFKLIIDGTEITEELLYRLATSKYPQFNIKKLIGCAKGEPYYSIYLYFPSPMLAEHSIQVVIRQKMVQKTYWFSGQAPAEAEADTDEESEQTFGETADKLKKVHKAEKEEA